MSEYVNPFGTFHLKRIPDQDKNLQAWNSADTYLLNHLNEQMTAEQLTQASILIINDDFGALTVSLAQYGCDTQSDSFVSHQAIKTNVQANCPQFMQQVQFIKSTEALNRHYDLVLFKVPKISAFLQQQMLSLAGHISDNSHVIGAVMAKNLQRSIINTLKSLFADAEASLAWKKARLILLKAPLQDGLKNSKKNCQQYTLEDGCRVFGLSNVFSRKQLDIGSRFFLQNFPEKLNPPPERIIDLGCGNGVLSLKAAQCYPHADIYAVDESYMAVESARMTLQDNLGDNPGFHFISTNILESFSSEQADLILCNPPFHQQHVVGDVIAWQMFVQSRKVLKSGGELWIVGNRHLAYHTKLKKLFGNQTLVATNNKFVILKAIKCGDNK